MLTAAAAAILGGCAAVPPPAPPVAGAVAVPSVDRLPAAAAGFRRGESRTAVPGRGREVAYATAGGGRSTAAATVELLAEDTRAEAALDAALAETLRGGPARDIRETGRFAIAAPGGGASSLLCAETAGRYGRERVSGLVCAGRAGGALVRIRVAMPAREPPVADPRAFAEAIAAALSGGAAVRAGAADAAPPSG